MIKPIHALHNQEVLPRYLQYFLAKDWHKTKESTQEDAHGRASFFAQSVPIKCHPKPPDERSESDGLGNVIPHADPSDSFPTVIHLAACVMHCVLETRHD